MNTPDNLLSLHGPPIRISDVMAMTGVSRPTIIRAMQRGDLVGFRFINRTGSQWLFERKVVVAWLDTMKSERSS